MAQRDELVAVPTEGRNQECCLVRLGAAVGEKDFVELVRCHRADALGELDLRSNQKEGRRARDAIELGLDRVVDFGDGVATRNGGDAAEEIEILATSAVEQELTF